MGTDREANAANWKDMMEEGRSISQIQLDSSGVR